MITKNNGILIKIWTYRSWQILDDCLHLISGLNYTWFKGRLSDSGPGPVEVSVTGNFSDLGCKLSAKLHSYPWLRSAAGLHRSGASQQLYYHQSGPQSDDKNRVKRLNQVKYQARDRSVWRCVSSVLPPTSSMGILLVWPGDHWFISLLVTRWSQVHIVTSSGH